MGEAGAGDHPQTIMDCIVGALNEGRTKAMRSRKAAIQKEFMIARRWIEDAYRGFDASDLPVDVHRIIRDLKITRDQLTDASCAEVDREFRIAVEVLKMVAQETPGYYSKAAQEAKPGPGYNRPLPPVSAPKIASVLPAKLLQGLTATLIAGTVTKILKSEDGVTFAEIAKALDLTKEDQLPQRASVKEFCAYLRTNGHVKVVGTGRGQRMMAAASLRQVQQALVIESEA